VLKITPHASRFTHMNQTDQFNVKCGDQTPDFNPYWSYGKPLNSGY